MYTYQYSYLGVGTYFILTDALLPRQLPWRVGYSIYFSFKQRTSMLLTRTAALALEYYLPSNFIKLLTEVGLSATSLVGDTPPIL